MKRLEQFQEELRENAALIAELERALAENPPWSDSIRVNLVSLRRLQANLESDFARAANSLGKDVCRYRLFSADDDQDEPIISGLASALNDFQNLFSLVFEALKRGQAKRTGHLAPETVETTSFRFGYTFDGSVGFALTLPNEAMLIGDSDHDAAMKTVFDLARAQDTDAMLGFTRRLGAAPIRAAYRWATDHVQARLGADIHWSRVQADRTFLFIQIQELQRLREIIERASEAETQTIEIEGMLVQADIERDTFRLKLPTGEEIGGSVEPGVFASLAEGVTLDRMYHCQIEKTTVLRLSMDTDEISYVLRSLHRI